LRALRGERKKSEFACFLGLSPPTYQKYEGGRVPRAETLLEISKRCGVPLSDLLGPSAAQPDRASASPRETHLREPPPVYGAAPSPADLSTTERLDRIEAQLQTLTQLLGATLAASVPHAAPDVAGGERKRKAG
jgi:transcriptional regulator with XRE-family HTH domain